MQKLIRLALSNKASSKLRVVLFHGSTARSTNLSVHAFLVDGEWEFPKPVAVSASILRAAIKIGGKEQVWSFKNGEHRLNGVLLADQGATDFPPPLDAPSNMCLLDFKTPIQDVVKRLLPAVAGNIEFRQSLRGIFVSAKDSFMCATDGRRLHLARDIIRQVNGAPDVIVPRELFTLATPDSLAVSESIISAKCGNMIITCKAIEETPPNYRRVIPSASSLPFTAAFGAEQLAVLRKAMILSKAVSQSFHRITIQANGAVSACDEFSHLVIAQWQLLNEYAARDPVAFQSIYLADAAAAIGDGVIRLGSGSDAALVSSNDGKFVAVVMPMRI